jgi:hypothetical protein
MLRLASGLAGEGTCVPPSSASGRVWPSSDLGSFFPLA